MTEPLFRADAYLREAAATVVSVNERGGIVLERTNFYAAAGGQPGDAGRILIEGRAPVAIATTVYDADKRTIVHVPATPLDQPIAPGTPVTLALDWETRFKHMRVHTAMHLMCALVKFPVTGGQIGAGEGRLDFDIPEASAIDKDQLTEGLNALVVADHAVSELWITDEEMAARSELVRTMAVKPPSGSGRVRLVAIGADGSVDLQPCGGTHVGRTGEIGRVAVIKIEKKGRQNRRVRLALV